MAMNRIQFQPGLSLPAFHTQFGTENAIFLMDLESFYLSFVVLS